MIFEKKYWSKDEYTYDQEGNQLVNGFVGIYDGEAYDFNTGKKLYKKSTYLTRINASKMHFDRVLSRELKLPYSKKDIGFAANDFLYGNIVKTAVDRLQENNDYIFRNAIISSSILPATNECILLASPTSLNNKGEFEKLKSPGILQKFNFSDYALSTYTHKDTKFYPGSNEEYEYFAFDKYGKKVNIIDNITKFIDGELPATSYLDNLNIPDEENDQLKYIWKDLHNGGLEPTDNEEVTFDEILNGIPSDMDDVSNKEIGTIFTKNNYAYNTLEGEYTFTKAVDIISEEYVNLSIKSTKINNLISALSAAKENGWSISPDNFVEETGFFIKKIKFIVDGVNENSLKVGDASPCSYDIIENKKLLVYEFSYADAPDIKILKVEHNIDESSKFTDIEFSILINLNSLSDKETINFLTSDEDDVEKRKIKFEIIYEVGTIVDSSALYHKVPPVERNVEYSFIWTDDLENEGGDANIYYANPGVSYKFLTETDEWMGAKSPQLSPLDGTDEASRLFIPKDNMTARDVYVIMTNNPRAYQYPKLYRKVTYTTNGKFLDNYENGLNDIKEILNPKYTKKAYDLGAYKFDITEDGKEIVTSSFKNIKNIYDDIYSSKIHSPDKYDLIPNIGRSPYKVADSSETIHNFNEIVASEIIIRDVDEDERKATLLIFLAFKDEIVIFSTDYYYANPSEGHAYKKDNYIKINANDDIKDEHLTVNLAADGCKTIVIKNIDPLDKTSLTFKNINDIKVHNNMMYIIDNHLDMVLRYDVDYLVNPSESLNDVFENNSIELIDTMQGSGDAMDKVYFNQPHSMAISDEFVYIIDRGNHCIKQYTHSLNYVKTLKNGQYTRFDIQAIAVNPYIVNLNDSLISANSLWVVYCSKNKIYISILDNGDEIFTRQLEHISLLNDEYTWDEEVRSIQFSKNNSNYFYINTNKRIYKLHASNPAYPFASLSYFKQRSLTGTMRWSAMAYPWHKIPSMYSVAAMGSTDKIKDEITWDYEPPQSSAEILDNKCFSLTGAPQIEGDIIFHFGILYDNSKIRNYIKKENAKKVDDKVFTFNDIHQGELATMIKSTAILLYSEPDSFISTIANPWMKIYDIYKLNDMIENDYINSLTFNKILHSLVTNLCKIKNFLLGHFRAATNLDNIIVYDNIIMSDYFNNLQLDENYNYYIHSNEQISIIINRVLENIYDIQEKIINKMQTEFMAAQSYVNNTSRII